VQTNFQDNLHHAQNWKASGEDKCVNPENFRRAAISFQPQQNITSDITTLKLVYLRTASFLTGNIFQTLQKVKPTRTWDESLPLVHFSGSALSSYASWRRKFVSL
jgi:hypothetical protein